MSVRRISTKLEKLSKCAYLGSRQYRYSDDAVFPMQLRFVDPASSNVQIMSM